jgi:hypothetical protein
VTAPAQPEDFVCFKFRAINKHLIESLVNPSLYFAKPNTLNDPFDCRLDLLSAFTRVASLATGDRKRWLSQFLDNPTFFDNWKYQLDNFGVCSFSLTMDETLLWSHYADEHRGVCLVYRFPESFILDPKLRLTAGGEVKYISEPLTEWLKNTPMSMEQNVLKELIHICLKTKSPGWRYEKEARLIRREPGIFNISGKFITEICFGLGTPQDDIDLVIKLGRDYCGCTTFTQMVRDDSDFGFTRRGFPVPRPVVS